MNIRDLLLSLNFIVIVALGGYTFYSQSQEDKKVFILNQRVFNEFEGTRQLETKLEQLKRTHQQNLDSLGYFLKVESSETLMLKYEDLNRQYTLDEKAISEKYTAAIWKDINQYIAEFGKEKHCDFIFGANGNGNLMFANEVHDVTDEVIQYVNKRYEDE